MGARQQRIQPRRRLFLHPREDVRIRVQRQRDRCVPEHLLNYLRMLAVYETERRGGVAKRSFEALSRASLAVENGDWVHSGRSPGR